MAYSFRRAAKAIAVTSSTTSVAFAANVLSPLAPFRAFGINAAIIILVNYALTIMLMPSVQAFYEKHIRGRCARCCLCCLKCCKPPTQKPAEPIAWGVKVDHTDDRSASGKHVGDDIEDPNRPNSREKFRPKLI